MIGFRPNVLNWAFADCIVTVRFNELLFQFTCPNGHPFNVYMNPYLHEFDVATRVQGILKEGDVVIDVGAMGGLYTILASHRVGSTGKVISVEPNPLAFRILQNNVELNNLRNVCPLPNAVGEQPRQAILSYDDESIDRSSIITTERAHTVDVEMVTIDAITEHESAITLLKIDTEGYDEKALEGARHTLLNTRYVIVETNTDTIRNWLTRFDFHCETLHPSGYLFAKRAR
jgi:FkbM family methyltransferase